MGMVVLTWLIGDPRGSATSIMVRLLQMCYAGGLVIKTLQWSSYKNLGPEWGGPRDFHPLWVSWLEMIMIMIPGHVFYCPNLCIYLPILSHMTKDLSVVLRPLTPHVEELVVAQPTYQEAWANHRLPCLSTTAQVKGSPSGLTVTSMRTTPCREVATPTKMTYSTNI